MAELHGVKASVLSQDDPIRKTIESESRELSQAMVEQTTRDDVAAIRAAIIAVGHDASSIRVEFSERSAYLYVDNQLYTKGDIADRREGDTTRYVGVRYGLLGQIVIHTDHYTYAAESFEYKFVDTKAMKRQWFRDLRETKSLRGLIAKIKAELTVNTVARVEAARDNKRQIMAADEARSTRWAREAKLTGLVEKHGRRAFEILAQSNVVLPDDFKQAMSDYLDLTEGGC
jgi:hypothetical protein